MYRLSRAPQLQQPRPLPPSTHGLSDQTWQNIVRFLLLGWEPQLIADREGCSRGDIYNVIRNLKEHGSVRKPPTKKLGKPLKISGEDADALFEQLVRVGWMYQDEIAKWLLVECGVKVSRQTVSDFLRSRGWSRRTLKPYSINRNEELRESLSLLYKAICC